MQVYAFKELLTKYGDVSTNPGAETIEQIVSRMKQEFTEYFFIKLGNRCVGALRITHMGDMTIRIATMFIIPQFQGKGYAQRVLQALEETYLNITVWKLDTIKEEAELCYLYEKMGFTKTGYEERINDKMTIVFYQKVSSKHHLA